MNICEIRERSSPTDFSIDDLILPFFMYVVGPRGKGKTTLTVHIIDYIMDWFDHIVVFGQSLDSNHDFDRFRTNEDVPIDSLKPEKRKLREKFSWMRKFGPKDIYTLLEHCEQIKHDITIRQRHRNTLEDIQDYANRYHSECGMDKEYSRPPRVLMVFDDALDAKVFLEGGPLDIVAARGRHCDISAIALTQKLRAGSSTIRENVEYVAAFKTNLYTELEKLVEENVSRTERKAIEIAMKQVYRKPFHFIFINRDREAVANEYGYSILYGKMQNLMNGTMKDLSDFYPKEFVQALSHNRYDLKHGQDQDVIQDDIDSQHT